MKFETSRMRRVQLAALYLLIASLLMACGGRKDEPKPTKVPEAAVSVQEEAVATEAPKPTNRPEPTEAPEEEQPDSPLSQTVSPLAQPGSPLAQPESPLDLSGD